MAIDYTKGAGEPEPTGTPVSLSKVTLTKQAPTVSLTKQGGATGTLRVNLNWTSRPAGSGGGGFFKRLAGGGANNDIDLDLGCLYEFSDGTKSAVQALGNAFRDRNTFRSEPYIWLDGDDRSGGNSEGENLYVDLSDLSRIRRVLVYAFIYEGVPNWAAADGVVTLYPVAGPQIEVRLEEAHEGTSMCGIAMIENVGGEISVRREARYVGGHRALDEAYQWGLSWTTGRK